MRIKTRRPGARIRALKQWHKWFAWFPVRIPTTGNYLYWLQHVQRKGRREVGNIHELPFWVFTYKLEK